jgi:hypothetical protein
MKTTKKYMVPNSMCWFCGKGKRDEAIPARGSDDGPPKDGDVSLCYYCYAISIFNEDLTLRKPTEEENARYLNSPEMQYALADLKLYKILKGEEQMQVGLDITTIEGVRTFMSQATDSRDWGVRCDVVKQVNGGYPPFWYQEIILSGLMDQTLGQGASAMKVVTFKSTDDMIDYLKGDESKAGETFELEGRTDEEFLALPEPSNNLKVDGALGGDYDKIGKYLQRAGLEDASGSRRFYFDLLKKGEFGSVAIDFGVSTALIVSEFGHLIEQEV